MKRIFAVLSLLAVVVVIYAPSLRDGYVWDDTALILRDPLIRSWRLIPESFNHFLFTDATASDFYRPVQRLTYTLDYAISAFRPGPYHLTSILWHALAAVALFLLAEEMLADFAIEPRRARLISFLSALAWAVHPVNSAGVVYVSGRADPLAAAFGFLGFYFVIRSLRAAGKNKLLLFLAAAGVFLLSALSKETGLIFPLLALVFLALRKNWSDVWKMTAVAALVSVTYFSLRLAAEHNPPPVLSSPAPLSVKPIVLSRAVAEYAGLILLPLNLHMDRDVESHPTGLSETSITASSWRELQTLLGILLIGALIYWVVRAYQRNFAAFVCLTLFLLTYLPISGLVALNATVAEHWLYLPSAFLFLAAALEIAMLLQAGRRWARSTTTIGISVLFGLWLAFLGVRTFLRTFDWKDEHTFFERTIAHGGDSARMLINLGGLELTEGKLEDAAVHLHAALQKKPDQPFAIINLAAVALKENDLKLAHELLGRAAKMDAVEAQAHDLLAVLEHKETGRANVLRMRLAARTGPSNWSIEKRYVMLLDQTGAHVEAIKELQNCLTKEWYRAESWQLLGQLLTNAGLSDLAALAFIRAHEYDVHLDAHSENQRRGSPILPSS
ncbi:MAG: protein O-mannosyl-transferase [Verrucomicrobiota bacterium]